MPVGPNSGGSGGASSLVKSPGFVFRGDGRGEPALILQAPDERFQPEERLGLYLYLNPPGPGGLRAVLKGNGRFVQGNLPNFRAVEENAVGVSSGFDFKERAEALGTS